MCKCRLVYFISLFILSSACQRTSLTTESTNSTLLYQKQEPKIVFINLDVQKDSVTSNVSVQLINKIIVNGSVKEPLQHQETIEVGSFICNFKDENNKTLKAFVFSNPLEQVLEYSTLEGNFEKKTISLQRNTLSLRTNLVPNLTKLEVQQVQPTLDLKTMLIIPVSL